MPYLVKTLPVDPQTDCDTQSMHTVPDYIYENLKLNRLLELTEFNKFVGYKINTQEIISTFLYTNNEITEKENRRKLTQIQHQINKIKYLINLNKEGKVHIPKIRKN